MPDPADAAASSSASLPPLEALRSPDRRISDPVWSAFWPVLHGEAARLSRRLLQGAEHEEMRRDAVATALAQAAQGLITGHSASFRQLQTTEELITMTLTILRRRINDAHRARRRRPEDVMEAPPEPEPEADPHHPPERHFTADELQQLYAAIGHLEPPRPEIIRLHYLEGFSLRETAERLGTNFSRVRGLLRDALTKLRGLGW